MGIRALRLEWARRRRQYTVSGGALALWFGIVHGIDGGGQNWWQDRE
jgi:hypothetical protein